MNSPRPLIGPNTSPGEQVRRWIESPIEFWEECSADYGDVCALNLGSLGTVILIADPAVVAGVFALGRDAFEIRSYNEHYRHVMGEHSVLVQDGDRHRATRTLLAPPFGHRAVLPEFARIRDIASAVVEGWPVETAFNPRPFFHEITFRVMASMLLGTGASETRESLVRLYCEQVRTQVGSWGPWQKFVRLKPEMRTLLADEIAVRRQDPTLPGLLTRFVRGADAAGAPLATPEIEDHVFTFLVAGVDTTALSLSWAMHWLSRTPGALRRLENDLAGSNLGPGDATVTDLPWLDAVFRETVRMYPVVPTPSGRKLAQDVSIEGYRFEAGTTLVPCPYLVHHREELFPDSHRFDPGRFMHRRYAPHEYFPFGGGQRLCIGQMFAPFEFKTVLTTILGRWELATADAPAVSPTRHGTMMAPSDDLRIVVRPRNPAGPRTEHRTP